MMTATSMMVPSWNSQFVSMPEIITAMPGTMGHQTSVMRTKTAGMAHKALHSGSAAVSLVTLTIVVAAVEVMPIAWSVLRRKWKRLSGPGTATRS